LARVPTLSSFLGFMSNRAAIAAPAAPGDLAPPPPGELDDAERRRLYNAAQEALDGLRGNDEARNLIYQRIIEPAAANPDNPFASNAPAMIVLLAGPPGIGKTTAAHAIAHLLVGVGAVKTAKIVTVRPTDLRGGEFGSVIQLARSKATAAKGGTLFIDDAGWLLASPDTYGGQESSGVDFGMTVVDVLGQAPGETVVIATMSEEELGRLKEDTAHARWLGKLGRREIVFDDLDEDALLDVLNSSLAAMNWRLESDDTAPASRRLLVDFRDRKGAAFNNADACRQTAEKLIEITSELRPDLAERRVITREIILRAEDEME
jgi:SpoVK/Ycf46/Vps4 family AAA+-type ATPase